MITEHMLLNPFSDAKLWASQLVDDSQQQSRIARYIWENKPYIGCSYEEFKRSNPSFSNMEEFWRIAEDD